MHHLPTVGRLTIHQTRFTNMGYAQIEKGRWQFINTEDGGESPVGPHYASKAELLADCERYCTEYGCSLR